MGPVWLTNADSGGLTSLEITTHPNHFTQQTSIVVERLSAPAILGCDFLRYGMIIDFAKGPFCSRESMPLEGRLNLPAARPCMFVLDVDCPQAAHFKDSTANQGDIHFHMKSHIKDPQHVLNSLLATGFTLRGFVGRDTITHLGFQYPQEGVTPTEERLHAVSDWPTPTNKEELRLANFSRHFVLNFADIARPLTGLTGAEVTFHWQDDQHQDFECLKQALMTPTALNYPRQTDTFVLTQGLVQSSPLLGALSWSIPV